ncbi:unnamed protein product [Spirodela intermedia]|uniref:Thioredoxin domain-containing protein n=1 Tax=Spirodela intermedia TaxID=51605 RepID=A0A7I8IKZ1_SPIIN|nr:unnamed protein product [Spirodela intermedia]CAA6658185.1 unnamed protein product [Spirodela intermedia]
MSTAAAAAMSGSLSSQALAPREFAGLQIGSRMPRELLSRASVARRTPLRPLCVFDPARKSHSSPVPPVAVSAASSEAASLVSVVETSVVEEVDFEKLAGELEGASPLEIMDKALEIFGNDIAIAFSGAEDVALIEYARLTGRPFRVFSLDTGRLNPETYRFFDEVEKRYNIRIEYMFPDAVEVQALVRSKGLFSFYEDGHQERALRGLRAWITGQRKDQSPGTRASVPVVQVDPSFEGMEGGAGSLVKWNPVANVDGRDIWNFLRTMAVPVNSLHSQHEREGRWWWEDAKAKECGLHKGNIKQDEALQSSNGNGTAAAPADAPVDIFNTQAVVPLSRPGIENLVRLENRKEPWLVVLYAPWCRFCQGMEESFTELAEKLQGSGIKVAKFRADGDERPFAEELGLVSFPTILFFPKHTSKPIKYPSEQRDVDSLLAFVNALR